MGQIRKVKDTYYIEFYARGLMYSQVASSEEEAQRMLKEIEAKIAQGESLTIVREIDLEVFLDKFLVYAADKYSPSSITRQVGAWDHWMAFLVGSYPNVKKLSQITPSMIESYKTGLVKTHKPKVVNLTILLLREILDYGIRLGFINDNPSLHISLMKLPVTKERVGRRSAMARDLLGRSLSLEKVTSLLKIKDVAKVMYWSNFIPLKREDVYN